MKCFFKFQICLGDSNLITVFKKILYSLFVVIMHCIDTIKFIILRYCQVYFQTLCTELKLIMCNYMKPTRKLLPLLTCLAQYKHC